MSRPFKLETTSSSPGRDYHMTLHGSLDASAAQRLRESTLAASAAGHPRVVADLSDVDFLASTGIGTLLLLTESLKKEGQSFVVCNLSDAVAQVIGLLNLSDFLTIESTSEGAPISS